MKRTLLVFILAVSAVTVAVALTGCALTGNAVINAETPYGTINFSKTLSEKNPS